MGAEDVGNLLEKIGPFIPWILFGILFLGTIVVLVKVGLG